MLTQYFNQPVSFKFLYKALNSTQSKLKEATIEFIECDDKAVKGNLVISGKSLFFVWQTAYNDNGYPKYSTPWIPEDTNNIEEARNILKQSLDKLCRAILKAKPLGMKLSDEESNSPVIVKPKLVNGKLIHAHLSTQNVAPEYYALAQCAIRQLNFIAAGALRKKITEQNFTLHINEQLEKLSTSKYA